MGDDLLEGGEPDALGLEGLLQPLLDEAPAGESAGEERVPDADPESARLILRIELLPEGLEALGGSLHRHHVVDLGVVGEGRPVICAPMDGGFPELACRSSHEIGDVVRHQGRVIAEAMLDEQVDDLLRDVVDGRAVAPRLAADALLMNLQGGFEGDALRLAARLDGVFVDQAVVADLVAVLEYRLDGVRVLLDAPGGDEEGLLQAEFSIGVEDARHGDGRAVATHGDGVEPVVAIFRA